MCLNLCSGFQHILPQTEKKTHTDTHTANKQRNGPDHNSSPNFYSVKIWMMRICSKINRAKKKRTNKQQHRNRLKDEKQTHQTKLSRSTFRMQICNCIKNKCLRALVNSELSFLCFFNREIVRWAQLLRKLSILIFKIGNFNVNLACFSRINTSKCVI